MNFVDFANPYQWVLIALVLWSIPWKGAAMWQAARREHKGWFIALLVINTFAILEIIYLFFVIPRLDAKRSEGTE